MTDNKDDAYKEVVKFEAHMYDQFASWVDDNNKKLAEVSVKLAKSEVENEFIKRRLKSIDEKLARTGVVYFLKHNWWKLSAFIISTATVLGALGEYLYRLPPPN